MASFQSKVLRYVVKYYIARSLRAEKPLQEQRDALERLEKIALSSPFSSIKKVDAGDVRQNSFNIKTPAAHMPFCIFMEVGSLPDRPAHTD